MLLSLAVAFLVIALIAYIVGARGVAGFSASIGRTLLVVFLILSAIFFIAQFVGHGTTW